MTGGKRLQNGSHYDKFDVDGDGVVTDEEMAQAEKLIELEFNLAKTRKDLMAVNDKVSAVKMMVEASEEYKQARLQKAKIDNARETILMAKKYATLASDQMRSGL